MKTSQTKNEARTNGKKTLRTGARNIFRVLFAATMALFTLSVPSLHATDATWVGTTSGVWSVATNWNGGVVPGSTAAGDTSLVTFNNNTNTTITYPSGDWVVSGITFTGNTIGAFTIGTNANAMNLDTSVGVHTLQTTADVNNAQTINAPLRMRGSGTYTFLSNATDAAATLNFGGNFTNLATIGLILDGSNTGSNTISGSIQGTWNIKKQGASLWILTGSNSYNQKTTITGGVLSVGTLANGGTNSGIGASINVATNLVLAGGALQYTGAEQSTDRLFSVGTSGGTLDASGSGAVNFTNTGAMGFNSENGSRTLTLTGNNTGVNTLAAVIGDQVGATALTKSGAGNWTISGNNTYTGNTTVTAGTLVLSAGGSIANSTVIRVQSGAGFDASAGGFQLQNGQTLQNKGTFTGSLTALSGSTYAPGNSPGIATQAGALALNTGSTFEWELVANSSANPGTNFDQTQFTTGGLTIESGVIASLVFNYAGSSVDWTNAFWDTNQSWTLFSGASTLSTFGGIFGTTTVGVDSLGSTLSAGRGSFSFSTSGNDVILNYAAVPEPAIWWLLAGAGTFFTVVRRRSTKA
ncbi:MAG: autotransporter-associated beta strand repeat-containing protein [Phycisphaerae bacterium]|jgi:fibronectin-binding autotransporter adhesin